MGDFNGLRKGDLALFLMKWSPPLCFSLNFDFSVSSKSVDSAPVLCGSVGDVTSITKLEDSSKDCDDMSIKANYLKKIKKKIIKVDQYTVILPQIKHHKVML